MTHAWSKILECFSFPNLLEVIRGKTSGNLPVQALLEWVGYVQEHCYVPFTSAGLMQEKCAFMKISLRTIRDKWGSLGSTRERLMMCTDSKWTCTNPQRCASYRLLKKHLLSPTSKGTQKLAMGQGEVWSGARDLPRCLGLLICPSSKWEEGKLPSIQWHTWGWDNEGKCPGTPCLGWWCHPVPPQCQPQHVLGCW